MGDGIVHPLSRAQRAWGRDSLRLTQLGHDLFGCVPRPLHAESLLVATGGRRNPHRPGSGFGGHVTEFRDWEPGCDQSVRWKCWAGGHRAGRADWGDLAAGACGLVRQARMGDGTRPPIIASPARMCNGTMDDIGHEQRLLRAFFRATPLRVPGVTR
jgi:hypothetical protein